MKIATALALIALLSLPLMAQDHFPAFEDEPVWVVDGTFWGDPTCHTYLVDDIFLQDDTLWHQVRRFARTVACDELSYDSLFTGWEEIAGYYAIAPAQGRVYGKKTLDGPTGLLYDFDLAEDQDAEVLFNWLTGQPLAAHHFRNVFIEQREMLDLGGQSRIRLRLSEDSQPFPAYNWPEPRLEYWIEGVGSTVNPFSAFSCIAYGCEETYQLNTLYYNKEPRFRYDALTNAPDLNGPLPSPEMFFFPDHLVVNQQNSAPIEVRLLDPLGRTHYHTRSRSTSVVLPLPPQLPAGVYCVQISKAGRQTNRLFFKP